MLLSGIVTRPGLSWEMKHPQVQWLAEDEFPAAHGPLPIYPLTSGVNQKQLRKIVRGVLDRCTDALVEVFPEPLLVRYRLEPLRLAVRQIHFPEDRSQLSLARRRFAFQELLVMQLALALVRRQRDQRQDAAPLPATARIDARIRRLFPFELTAGQQSAIAELSADMARSRPMNRLLQGDVGSGKTVVAVYGMLLAVAHGFQTVLMAPTEVLARQHWQTIDRLLSASRVRRALLMGGMPAAARKQLLDDLAAGEMDLVIGTQALVESDVNFARLGLIVIDEAHRFGVRQRASLKSEAAPHYLVMTATPIPRTVGMTSFGDLDVTTLRDTPPGRQPVNTYLAEPGQRERWWSFVRKKLEAGRQGYVIAAMIETAAGVDTVGVEETYRQLQSGPLSGIRLGLLHGRMTSEEKDRALEDFRARRTQVLVATSVVEVGIDVPNATLMTIENGERFGLATLHQLRGRISRGAYPGFCCVFAAAQTADARERLESFVNTSDGFALAELDMRLRGPGNLLGTQQHGLPPLLAADLVRDAELTAEARRDALALVGEDPELAQAPKLRAMVEKRYSQVFALGDVG